MDLGNIFKKQEEKPPYFWSLVIGKSWVQAGIWRVVGEKTEVVAEGTGASWEEGNRETLIQAADSTLSAAAGSFEEEAEEPTEVVFGLPPSWVADGAIKPEKLELLKKLSQELELRPAGFVVLPEAIVHFLKAREGTPPNIILVGIFEDVVEVSLVENGKIMFTAEVGRSMSLGADVAEGLARIPQEQHPSRIVLYNHKTADLEEARQNLLETDWSGAKVSFLHTPKIEILEEDAAIPAVSLAGGAEVGQAKTVTFAQEAVGDEEEQEGEKADEQAPPDEELVSVSPEELGFLAGRDVASEKQEIEKPKPLPAKKTRFPTLPALGGFLPKVSLPKLSLPSLPSGRGVTGIVLTLLAGLLLFGGLAYWYIPKATVTIYVAPKTLEREIVLKIDPTTSVVNQQEGIIPGRRAQTSVSGEKTTGTTGTKTVGDKARGKVTIYRTGPRLVLPRGTVLTAPNNLKFVISEETEVASGSAVKRGEAEAEVTAGDIGAQYNLAAGTAFSVGNFSESDLGAENKEAFGGGSSREVSSVAEDDRKQLEEDLTAELKEQGFEKLKASLVENEGLIGGTVEAAIDKKDFSHKVGEEATTLKLTQGGTVSAAVVPKDALNSLLTARLKSEVPQGYILREEQIKTEFKPQEDEEGFAVAVVANLLPQVNPSEVANTIKGKYPDLAKDYLSSIPGFTRAEISFSFRFPGRLGTLPRIAKNIIIEVSAER